MLEIFLENFKKALEKYKFFNLQTLKIHKKYRLVLSSDVFGLSKEILSTVDLEFFQIEFEILSDRISVSIIENSVLKMIQKVAVDEFPQAIARIEDKFLQEPEDFTLRLQSFCLSYPSEVVIYLSSWFCSNIPEAIAFMDACDNLKNVLWRQQILFEDFFDSCNTNKRNDRLKEAFKNYKAEEK